MSDATTSDGGQKAMDDFVQMSALLTGFAADTIAPPLDPVDLRKTLFEAAQKGAGAAFDALLVQYAKLSGGKPVEDMSPAERQSIGEQLLGLGGHQQDPRVAATARSVNRMWYLGYWYPIDGGAPETVISDQAYIRGLAWRVMQSHAMGYSPWRYGYWSEAPPPLTDFTGNPEPDSAVTEPPEAFPLTELQRAPSTLGQGKGGQSPASLSAGDPEAAGTEGG